MRYIPEVGALPNSAVKLGRGIEDRKTEDMQAEAVHRTMLHRQ